MAVAKRIFLFLVVNFLVFFTISIILNVFHLTPYLSSYGLDTNSLMIFCLIWGMGGAFISLCLSRIMAKWMMGVKVISPNTTHPEERHLLEQIHKLTKKAGISMPEVGIYSSNEVNAFATGPTQNRSLVAVSSGLLNRMQSNEVEAILGHEVSHIANGDMVTMTLLQGVINAFVMFLARILAYAFSSMGKEKNSSSSFFSYMIMVYVFEVVFMILGSLVICAFSRFREYRADKGGAYLSGKQNMIAALQSLQHSQQVHDPRKESPALQAFKISTPSKNGFLSLFATHPPIEKRIERLKNL